ncbi:fumarylacetoacetate hydrolase family protein [Paenibacillus sp. PDC88]|uniref:fumarylacetoacetate hydrolase family protein n=1 Tax=Paenibacillus sp. PDC88 TaxID=1884375 RepID=UPI000899BEF1|nr:fumarylacetoacetate hydrolase family protein [Paenibacillus sp. PDC88]SDW20749.1 2-keto-4-pentenoate hydratase/2-oxohepta-3-ene-1,7-dioic acid hydratase (catechol pathway) [Paenibacillus sp. PDC88]
MNSQIRNVYCVGRNYRLHAEELGNAVPDEPMIFMKPSHAVVLMEDQELTLPGGRGEIHYEAELVVRIGADHTPGMNVDEVIDAYAFGIDFTLRDVQSVIKQKGHPWTAAKGFKNSAPISKFEPVQSIQSLTDFEFTLNKNEEEVQRGNIRDMIFTIQNIADYLSEHYGLGPGDIIFTGTPAGVGPVEPGDRLELTWADEAKGSVIVRY